MKSIVFDAGPVISFTANNLLDTLEGLQKKFAGDFLMPESVKGELVDKPLQIKRFEFEALQVQQQIECGTFRLVKNFETVQESERLSHLANSVYYIHGKPLTIVHFGEMSVLAAAKLYHSEAVIIDERTTRLLVEAPTHLAAHLKNKFKAKVRVNERALSELRKRLFGITVLRSAELAAAAFELGLLDKFVNKCRAPNASTKKILLDSVLWGIKLEGCAIAKDEIDEIVAIARF